MVGAEMTVVPEGYRPDALGRVVPVASIKPTDLLRNTLVLEAVESAKALHQQLLAFKARVFGEVEALEQISREQYDVKGRGKKGSLTLASFDGRYKLVRQNQDLIVYQVLERQLQKTRREYLDTQKRCKRSTKVARGDAFANAWIEAVYNKIDPFAGVDEGVAEAIDTSMTTRHPSLWHVDLKRRKLKARDQVAADAGYGAGQSAPLHRAVSHQPHARLTMGE